MPTSVFAELHSRAPGQSSTSGIECHAVLVGSQVQLQECVSPGTGSCGISRLSSLCWTIISLTARKRNSTNVSLCRQVLLKLNSHILYCTQCTMNWSVTCFWYCRTAEDTLWDCIFDFYWLTYLVSSLVVPHLQKCQNWNENVSVEIKLKRYLQLKNT